MVQRPAMARVNKGGGGMFKETVLMLAPVISAAVHGGHKSRRFKRSFVIGAELKQLWAHEQCKPTMGSRERQQSRKVKSNVAMREQEGIPIFQHHLRPQPTINTHAVSRS